MKQWEQVAIFGVGLIGGSIGLGLRSRGLAGQVVGIGRRRSSLQAALDCGAVDRITTDLHEGVREASLVIVCTPVELIVERVRQIADVVPAGTLLTDVGSTKSDIVNHLADLPKRTTFVGSHPMAGSEKTGVASADAQLFAGRNVVVTPHPQSPSAEVDRLTRFWETLGANVLRMTADEHDEAVAAVSHLPHVLASTLAAATPAEHLRLAATGWADTTRVASGDPELWRQILTQNREHILQAIDNFDEVLAALRSGLADRDDSHILRLLEAGKRNRDSLGS